MVKNIIQQSEENIASIRKETSEKPNEDLNKEVINKETIDKPIPKEEISAKQKETDVNKTETKTEDIDKSKVIENESKTDLEDNKPSFKVIPKETEKTETKQEDKETETLSEDKVKSFLKSKYGIDVSDFNEFSKPEKLSDPVAEFKKFNEQTGRGINAYYNSKRDWSKEESDATISEFYKYQNPNLSDEDIKLELDIIKLTDEEKEELSPREVKEIESKYRKEHSKAVEYMNNLAKDYSLPLEQGKPEAKKELTADEISKMYAPHREKVNKSLEKLNEISINFEGLGELKTTLTQEQKDLIYNRSQTEKDFFSGWTKEDGSFDTDKSSLDIAWSIPEIRNELISEYLIQAHTKMKEQDSKTRRNVTIDSKKEKTPQETKSIMTTFGASESNKMGTPLIPARRN